MLLSIRTCVFGIAILFALSACGGGGGGGDELPPDVTAPADITVEATGPSGVPASQAQIAAFLAGSSAFDIEDPNPTLSQNAPATFPLGATVVTFTYTDDAGNQGSASATVNIVDTVAPVVTAPANIAVEAPGTAAINAFLAGSGSTDLVDPAPVVTNDAPASFPLGVTIVTFTHTDASGNADTASASVTVSDTIAPGVTAPAAITVEAASAAGTPSSASAIAAFLSGSSAVDAGDPSPTFAQNAPAVLPLGTTLVTFLYTDWAGNSDNAVSSVTVVDTTPPAVTAPADLTVEADGPGGTAGTDAGIVAFLGGSSAIDIVDPSPSSANDAPSTFPLGPTVVTFTYTDADGNIGTGSATVMVVDTTPPAVTAPTDITVEATSPAGLTDSDPTIAAFLSASSAIDSVDAAPVASNDAPSTFPLGANVVTFTYTDASGNAGSQAATVNVVDTVSPVVTAPGDITVEAVSMAGTSASDTGIAAFLAGANATDAVDVSPALSDDAPATFPLGDTLVTFTFTDGSGNAGSATATVSVVDTTPPVIMLIGADPLEVPLYSTFTDPGSSVSDAVSTGLSATVIGTVNTSSVGAYVLSYDVTDAEGNAATTVTRTVNVVVLPPENVSFSVSSKHLNFTWDANTALDHWRILVNPDGASGFSVVPGADLITRTATGYDLEIAVHRTDWNNALFLVESCDIGETQCMTSTTQALTQSDSVPAIFYIKQSNTPQTPNNEFFGSATSISDDGNTMAIGAYGEGSVATGINGDQTGQTDDFAGAVYLFVRSGPTWVQQAYIKASNTDAGDEFGYSVALSADGNTLVVGARGESSNATGIGGNQANNDANGSGAVYVFTRIGSSWTQQAYIKASNTDAGDSFGIAVAVSSDGNTLVVGAQGERSAATGINGNQTSNAGAYGAAYVFTRSGSTWTQQAYFKASNRFSAFATNFGGDVAISADGNTVAVGDLGENNRATGINGVENLGESPNSGAVYVFTRSGITWSQQAYVKASNTDNQDFFGASIALSDDGNTMAIGAQAEDSAAIGVNGDQSDESVLGAGAVYLFIRSGSTWSQQAYIKASNTGPDGFGRAVALNTDGNLLAVGANVEDSNANGVGGQQGNGANGSNSGAAYLFVRSGSTWTQTNYIKAKSTLTNDFFGESLSMSADGNTLAISAPQERGTGQGINPPDTNINGGSGAVYVY